jgi:16S rRNA (guanine527-N7)-methyltransferase
MNEQTFIEEIKHLGIELNEKQINQFKEYYKILVEENEKINLTSIIKEEDVYLKHFYDSATISKIIDLNKEKSLCDIGSGAGLPGVVLKILYPHLSVTLVDSLNKRINFLNTIIDKLGLKDIVAIHNRAEEYGMVDREKFDVVTARAVTKLPILLEYCIPLTKVGKNFISMKGDISQEIIDSKNALSKLFCTIDSEQRFLLPIENSKRTLLLIRKNKSTPVIFPRKNSEIIKYPL